MSSTPKPGSPAAEHPYGVLRNRNLRLYLIGRIASALGQQMLTVAIGWELYQRTHSALNLGLVGLTQFLPMLLMTIPAGHVADNYNRRTVILITQFVLVLSSIGLTVVSWFQTDVFWVYVCLFIGACARTFLWSSSASFMPQLVSREDFPRAVTWSASTFQFAAVTGPAVGGALIALTGGAVTVYLLNALAGTVCFWLVYLVTVRSKPVEKQKFSVQELLAGFRYVFNTPMILAIITLDLFAVLFGGATTLLPVFAKDILHVGPAGLGLLTAALPVGALVCALYFAHRPPMQRAGPSLLWAVVVFGVATIGFGFSKWFPLSFATLFACGFADNISVIVRHTLVQLLTPDEMRGRVSSVNSLFIGTSNELGGFESGVVSQYFGPVFSVVSGGIATILVVAAIAWKWPGLRKYGRLVAPK